MAYETDPDFSAGDGNEMTSGQPGGGGEETLDAAWVPTADANPPAELQILRDEPVSRYTSFRVGGPADFLARPADVPSLRAALAWAREAKVPVTIIGGGSNLICSDRGIRGLAISYRAERVPLD